MSELGYMPGVVGTFKRGQASGGVKQRWTKSERVLNMVAQQLQRLVTGIHQAALG